jgi:subtilase family serine protease
MAGLLLAATVLAGAALAQTPADQIQQKIDAAKPQALLHHHPQWANPGNDLGPLPADRQMTPMTLLLARPAEREAAFLALLAEQQNPASPQYHHWLTPAEVGERFGLSENDLAALTGWLQGNGLVVNQVSQSRAFITFSGSAAAVGRAFHTEVHRYSVLGTERFSVSSDPQLPQTLIASIHAVRGLYTVEEHPNHRAEVQSADPLVTSSTGTHYLAPADFATIYSAPSNWTGAGQTIGIVGRSRTNFADFANFRSKTGVNFYNPNEIIPTAYGGLDPGAAYTTQQPASLTGEQGEATLDVLRAGSTAPGAQLLLVVATSASGGIDADTEYLVDTTPVPAQAINISFGNCESVAGSSSVTFWDTLFQQAAAEGISVFVSSGDSGAAGCDGDFNPPPANPAPISPNYICSSSYATCVGGTEFNDTNDPSAYWSSSNSSYLESAYGYIPEGGWNDPLTSSSTPQIAASGGGVSAYIATPSWQAGTGVPTARAGRYTPDVSFSGSCHDGYFGCFAAGGGSCVTGTNGSFSFESFCGTSAAAPAMAGVAALLDQKMGTAQGNLNPGLYATATSSGAAFNDVTVASSGVSNCSVNTPSMCNNSAPGTSGLSGGEAGYLVGAGYDQVTGLGSLNVASFLNNFAAKTRPTVSVNPSPSSINVLQPLTVTVSVAGSSANPTPTGSVVLTGGGYTTPAVNLSGGGASILIPAQSLAAGIDTLTVQYTPDSASSSTYAGASGSNTVTVSLVSPVVTVTLSSAKITTAQALTVTVAVSGRPTPTGSISLYDGGYGGLATLSGGSATFNIAAGVLTVGTDTLTAYYLPDTQSNPIYYSNSGTNTVTVTATASLRPSVTVTASASTTALAEPLPVTIAVGGGSGNPTPTGAIVLTSGNYSSASTTLSGGSAAITIPAGSLTVGADTLTALYTPDATSSTTYTNSAGSTSVSVLNPAISVPVVTITPASSILSTAQALSVAIAVSGGNGYPITTGSVFLTGGGYTSAPATLSNNSATIVIPAGSLAVGSDTLTVSYTPDAASSAIFYSAANSTLVMVTAATSPSFSIAGTALTLERGTTTGNTSAITVTPSGGFTGPVALTAAIATSPNGAIYPPTFSFSPCVIAGVSPCSSTLTVATTAASSSALRYPRLPWYAGGGTALASLLLLALPRRRSWRRIFAAIVLAALAGGMAACGSSAGINTGGGGGGGIAGTTTGTYLVTVAGTSGTTTAQTTVTIVVQ